MTNIIDAYQFKTISNSVRSLRVGVLVAALLIPASLLAGPITVNWDDLPNGAYNPTPGGYGGLNWYFGDGSFGSAGSGDFNGQLQYSTTPGITLLSSPNAAYNAWGCTPMRIESQNTSVGDEFTFSGYFSGQGYAGFSSGAYQIEVQGFTGGSSTADFTQYLTLSATGWTELNLTTAVNKVLLTPLAWISTERN
jgi:hypothetical protein